MIYTMGHKENYLKAIAENGEIYKMGRDAEEDYHGGIACQSFEDAQQAIQEIGQPTYAVFGVDADWDKDTVPSVDHRWHDLLVSSPIIVLDEDGSRV